MTSYSVKFKVDLNFSNLPLISLNVPLFSGPVAVGPDGVLNICAFYVLIPKTS
jgi:hypothetical protein